MSDPTPEAFEEADALIERCQLVKEWRTEIAQAFQAAVDSATEAAEKRAEDAEAREKHLVQMIERDKGPAPDGSEAPGFWRCFGCGFFTSDEDAAAVHFGEPGEESAICEQWAFFNEDERAAAWAGAEQQLRMEREALAASQALVCDAKERLERMFHRGGAPIPLIAISGVIDTLEDALRGASPASPEPADSKERT